MRYVIIPFLLSVMLLLPAAMGDAAAQDPFKHGVWEKPTVSEVKVSLKNASGFYQLNFKVLGGSEPGTKNVEVAASFNGTGIEPAEDMWWSEEKNFQLFNNRILLNKEGDANEPWSNWSFEVNFALSSAGGLEGALSSLSMIPGLGMNLGNVSLEDMDLNSTNMTKALAEMQFYFLARAYNETGAWGQDAVNITGQVQTAILGFLIEEGLIEEPAHDGDDDVGSMDDDTETESGGKDVNYGLVIGISVLGAVLLLTAVGVAVVVVLRKQGKE